MASSKKLYASKQGRKRRPSGSLANVDNAVTYALCHRLVSNLTSPLAVQLAEALRVGDPKAIVAVPFPAFSNAETFAQDYLAYNLLRKYGHHDLTVDRKAAALSAFHESERRCSEFNAAGPWSYPYDPTSSLDLQVTSVLDGARQIVAHILGRLDITRWMSECRFSSGASVRLRRKAGDAFYKMQGRIATTANCRKFVESAIRACPVWYASKQLYEGLDDREITQVVRGSKYITVPKDWKTERGITPENEGNMYLQSGIGGLIRKRLKKAGLDLNSQERNQNAARRAFCRSLSTLDLSQASDSVSLRICEELLPREWFHALMITRSAETLLPDGSWHRLEKMSSMGNGFTFELESLLFYAMALAVTRAHGLHTDDVCVYGDDIIVPRRCAPDLIRILNATGFVINTDKSFVDGPFFESCGKHYFEGVDVTPFHVKSPLDEHPAEICRLHNRTLEHKCSWEFSDFREWLREAHPSFMVPFSFPDKSGYWVEWDRATPPFKEGSWHVRCWVNHTQHHDVSSSIFGYCRSLLQGAASQERSIEGFQRNGYWCFTRDNSPSPCIGVSSERKFRKGLRTVTEWCERLDNRSFGPYGAG